MPRELPSTGKISIKTSPSDAEIFVNNIDREVTTPKSIILPSGSHLITLRKKNYSDYTFCCEIIAGQTSEKKVELLKPTDEPIPTGELKIESTPSHSAIYVNLEDTGLLTPETLQLAEGSHLITLKQDSGYDDESFCVEIIQDELLEKFIELKKATGDLSITSNPSNAHIWLANFGEESKDTMLLTPEKITLDPTSPREPITVTLRGLEGFENVSFETEIIKGKEIEKHVELVKTPEEVPPPIPPDKSALKLISYPYYASIYLGEKDTGRITPELMILDPGDYEIRVKKTGYNDKTVLVTLEKGKELEKFVELTKLKGVVPPDKSGLKIVSKPSAASIFLGEKDTGRITPELLILEPGEHEITVKKQDYEDKTVSVTVEEGKQTEKFIQLTKIEGLVPLERQGVKITSKPTAASIFVNGENTERITPELLILEPGVYTITLKKPSYEDKTFLVTIEEGKEVEKFVELTKIQGAAPVGKSGLKIFSTPSATSIFLNGEDTGRITPELLILEPGTYTITLKKPGYEDRTFLVTIEAEKEIEKHIELEKIEEPTVPENIGELYIISNPRYAKVYVDGADTLLITPVLLFLTPATYNITLKRGGYNDVSFNVTIIRGKKIEKFIEFPDFGNGEEGKRIGQLHIESKPQHAEIWEDGSNLELLTPETLTLTPGTKSITLKKSGFDDYAFPIQIVAGEKSEKLCELTKSTGELFLQSRPSRAKIWIDDKDSHLLTPEKLILSPGKKRIGLSYPAFLSALYIVDIVKGGKIEKFHRFAIPRDAIKTNKDDSFDDNIHVRDYCMQCDNPPEYDVLFSEGNLRAWLCAEHCKAFVREASEKINAIRRIDNGKATSKFRENINPNVLSRFIRDMQRISQKKQLVTDEELAPVNASGVELGEKITLKEILPYFKSFYHTKPYVSLIGGICNRGSTTGDIDIFINSNHRDLATEFRIVRSFPQDYWHRFNFRYPYQEKTHPGKFTNHVDIYDQKIEAIREPELVLMSVPKKVELFKPTFPLIKPLTGRRKLEEYTVDNLISVVNEYWDYKNKIAVQRKLDGVHCRADHSKEGKVKIYTEEGNEITDKCPTIVSEFKEICKGHDVMVTGELESWTGETFNPRQRTAAIIHSKGIHEEEKTLKLNIFDCLYYN